MGGRGSMGGTRSTYRGESTRLFNEAQAANATLLEKKKKKGAATTSSSGGGGGGGGGGTKKQSASASTGGINGGGGGSGGGGGGSVAPKPEPQTTDVNDTNPPPDVDLESLFQASPEYAAFDKRYENASAAVYEKKYEEAFTNWVQSKGDKAPAGAPPFRLKDHNRRTGQDLIDDIEAVNPRHGDGDGEWDSNCQRCTMAVEFRAKGYDVTALPLTEGYQRSGYDANGELKPPKTTFGAIANMFTTADGGKRGWTKTTKGDRRAQQIAQLENHIKSWPEGSRGFVGIDYTTGGSHIFNVEVRDGQPYYIDGQIDQHGPSMFTNDQGAHNWKLKFNTQSDMWVMRVDDLTPNEKAAAWVRERTIEEKNAPTATELGDWLEQAYPDDMPGLTPEQIDYLREAFENGWDAIRTGQTPMMPPEYADTPIVVQAWEAGINWARRPA